MDLSGKWQFELDPEDAGLSESWQRRQLTGEISLPGSLQAQGFGNKVALDTEFVGDIHYQEFYSAERFTPYRQPGNIKMPFWPQLEYHYTGAAWYQRAVAIPDDWRDARLELVLERPHWETRVWLDEREIGVDRSLSTPHVYDLGTGILPGAHILTIRVDNRLIINVGPNSHSVSDHTQTNWNGIAGRIELRKCSPLWLEDVQLYPDVANRSVHGLLAIRSALTVPVQARLLCQVRLITEQPGLPLPELSLSLLCPPGDSNLAFDYPMSEQVELWDEFRPALYQADVSLRSVGESIPLEDHRALTFGFREVGTQERQVTVNGKKIFLRGTLECCIFPQTGYPPCDVASWRRIIRICQDYGLNHIRFHSYCPPEAAFIAGDELGMYFQVECASWANQGAELGMGGALDGWLYAEAHRIIKAYGNHPSFLMMAYGNEPAGKIEEYLTAWVTHWQANDPRRLHTSGAGWPVLPESDYHSTPTPRIQAWGEGNDSRINARPPETETDYRSFVAEYEKPVISHEIGQWCAFPNLYEIAKYSGSLKAKNFEIFRDMLAAHHMADQARDFLLASGKLQVLCYKEEIESALRTPGFGGFQLLDLHDFPGQGTALVGVLDAFWDSKGYVTPQEYRSFCGRTVLLARMNKRYWKTSETFTAAIEVAHFGEWNFVDAEVRWQLLDEHGITQASGAWQVDQIERGGLRFLGVIQTNLASLFAGKKYRLEVRLVGEDCCNDWDIWVFADQLDLPVDGDILVTAELDPAALNWLSEGGKVLWLPAPESIQTDCQIGFSSVFWNTAWTGDQPPHTLGILCDPRHPVFEHFPTEYHSNWQWWELVHGSAAMLLDELPPAMRPLIQPIDTWFDNRRLGLLFEGQFNGGKLMICSMDLAANLSERLVARQMRYSILQYMRSPAFLPTVPLDMAALQRAGIFPIQ